MLLHSRSVLDSCEEYANPATEAKDAITRSFGVYVVGLLVTTQAELDQRKALHAGFLVPLEILMDRCHARIRTQRGGASVPA
ncbi:hypothetical protein Plhal710r2_c038g0134221 [Plasmopara halstedii]